MSTGRTRRSPGWYQDPDDPTRVRHWNGRGWTGRRRARPSWHVLANDLTPDPGWGTPGGISAAAQRQLLDETGSGATGDYGGTDDLADRPFRFEWPPFDDSRGGLRDHRRIGDPLGENTREGPLHAERPSRDWGFRSGPPRSDRYRGGSRSGWGSAAAFGLDSPWAPRLGGGRSGFVGNGGISAGSGVRPAGSAPASRWRRTRVPLIVVVGLTLFSVIALLVNLGTGARGRFSVVSVDAAFISQANAACVTALGGRRVGSNSVMTAGPASPGSGSGGSAAPSPSASSVGSVPSVPAASRTTSDSAASSADATESAAQLTVLAHLAARLHRLKVTPSARPEVEAWLGEWRRYGTAEGDLAKAEAARDEAAQTRDQQDAHVAAADADLFAADNSLSACAIGGPSDGLEPIP